MEAQVPIKAWRHHFTAVRTQSSPGYRLLKAIVMPGYLPGSAPPTGRLGWKASNALASKLDEASVTGHGQFGTIFRRNGSGLVCRSNGLAALPRGTRLLIRRD